MFGLHESTQTLEAMKEGMSKSLETLSEIGDKVQEAAVRAGYGPTIRADAVKKLVAQRGQLPGEEQGIIEEMRKLSTQNSAEIRDASKPARAAWRSLSSRVRPCRRRDDPWPPPLAGEVAAKRSDGGGKPIGLSLTIVAPPAPSRTRGGTHASPKFKNEIMSTAAAPTTQA